MDDINDNLSSGCRLALPIREGCFFFFLISAFFLTASQDSGLPPGRSAHYSNEQSKPEWEVMPSPVHRKRFPTTQVHTVASPSDERGEKLLCWKLMTAYQYAERIPNYYLQSTLINLRLQGLISPLCCKTIIKFKEGWVHTHTHLPTHTHSHTLTHTHTHSHTQTHTHFLCTVTLT